MPRYFVAYVAALAVLAVLDALWLGAVAKDFYRGQIGPLMAEQVRFGVAACFYLLYIVGVVVFAVVPALAAESVTRALMLGALFGFFAYMTYDLTNLATLRGWSWQVTLTDIAWGSFVSAVAAGAGCAAALRFGR
ncbi:MAG: DUF2177 family protein [Methylibium sp.]|uniref:DUF2177 family protein n=1 Tax=Methylibium sp. T29-B TaxID=1437443 RepID=UPI0003F43188|nr:DUF2177 family protein [Methylibium sp. T29-B]EWS58271.1 putative membrane protein [Methylibium sp. T29-B]